MKPDDIRRLTCVGVLAFVVGFLVCAIMVISVQSQMIEKDVEYPDCPENITTIYIVNESTSQEHNSSTDTSTVCIPWYPPEPGAYIIIRTNTPVSEPYYISKMPPRFEVGDWVKSNPDYEHSMNKEFQGQVVEAGEDGVMFIRTNENETRWINETWLEHWICEMIIHDPEIGYYCYTNLLDKTYKFTENSTVVSAIFEDVN